VKIINVREQQQNQSDQISLNRCWSVEAEAEIWERVCRSECKFVVQLHVHFFEKELFYMVSEMCTRALLDEVEKDMTEADLCGIFRQMLQGVSHVHSLGVVHRDVKPDNFLWGLDNCTLKLCDFGVSQMMPESGKIMGVAGTAPYMAPEMVKGDGYDYGADMWSLGATAHLLVFGKFPYSPESADAEAFKKAIQGDVPALRLPEEGEELFELGAVQFVKTLLVREPVSRPGAAQALKHWSLVESCEDEDAGVNTPQLQPRGFSEASIDSIVGVRKAKELNTMVERTDPTYQTSIDELLQKLVEKGDGLFSFSDADTQVRNAKVHRISKRNLRRDKFSTHSGVTSDADADGLLLLSTTSKELVTSAESLNTTTDDEHPQVLHS